MRKQVTAMLLCIFLSGSLAAASGDTALERAIEAARQKLDIPLHYANFSSNLFQDGLSEVALLSWSGEGNDMLPGGDMTVKVDQKGRILYYSNYEFGSFEGSYRLSGLDYDQAAAAAGRFLKETCPEFYPSLRAEEIPNYRARNSELYYIRFYRYENDIPFFNNYAIVALDGATLRVAEMEVVWDDIQRFPAPVSVITLSKAKRAFTAGIGFEAGYYQNPAGAPVLLYGTKQDGGSYINAYTGEVTPSKIAAGRFAMHGLDFAPALSGTVRSSARTGSGIPLSPEAVAENVRAALSVPASYALTGTEALTDDGGRPYYAIQLADGAEKSLRLSADAATGEVFRYATSIPYAENMSLTQARALQNAEIFLKSAAPQKAQSVSSGVRVPSAVTNRFEINYDYTFLFRRLIDGIEYKNEGMRVTVSAATGAITDYALFWSDQTFPSPAVLSTTGLEEEIFKRGGFTLQYVPVAANENPYPTLPRDVTVLPVYSFTPARPLYADPSTGALCYSNGQPYLSDYAKGFADIEGHPYQTEVETLLFAGILSPAARFQPDDPITQMQFLYLILRTAAPDEFTESFDLYQKMIYEKNVLPAGERNDSGTITVSQAVRYLINFLGYGEIARLEGTFKTSFSDHDAIAPSIEGYAAIAQGMGIVSQSAFSPDAVVTRARACEMLYHLLVENK